MQRWNGWGDENIKLDPPPPALEILQNLAGSGQIWPDYPLAKFIGRIPPSRLTAHPLISFDARLRLDHAHGQSLPEWIGLRGGKRRPMTLIATARMIRTPNKVE